MKNIRIRALFLPCLFLTCVYHVVIILGEYYQNLFSAKIANIETSCYVTSKSSSLKFFSKMSN